MPTHHRGHGVASKGTRSTRRMRVPGVICTCPYVTHQPPTIFTQNVRHRRGELLSFYTTTIWLTSYLTIQLRVRCARIVSTAFYGLCLQRWQQLFILKTRSLVAGFTSRTCLWMRVQVILKPASRAIRKHSSTVIPTGGSLEEAADNVRKTRSRMRF